jgi:RNA recognition motif-containing protein
MVGLPQDARSEDVAKFFDGYGRIVDVRVMTGVFICNSFAGILDDSSFLCLGFGFVEFESSRVGLTDDTE